MDKSFRKNHLISLIEIEFYFQSTREVSPFKLWVEHFKNMTTSYNPICGAVLSLVVYTSDKKGLNNYLSEIVKYFSN